MYQLFGAIPEGPVIESDLTPIPRDYIQGFEDAVEYLVMILSKDPMDLEKFKYEIASTYEILKEHKRHRIKTMTNSLRI